MLMSLLTIPAFAAGPVFELTTSNGAPTAGEEFTVTVSINQEISAVGALDFYVDYGTDLTVVSSAAGASGAVMDEVLTNNYLSQNKFKFSASATDFTNGDTLPAGVLATITFKVSETLEGVAAIPTLSIDTFTDKDFGDITHETKTEIYSVDVAITAPVKGATPQATIAEGTGYTGTIEWNGNPTTFAPNTKYTASVTLTAKAGYQFASLEDLYVSVPAADYVMVIVSSSNASQLVFSATFPQTADKNALQGIVTINNTYPKYGQTLTATPALNYNGESEGTLSYQWYRGDTAISGATDSTYTLVAADVGQTIKVEVKNSNNSGSVFSAPTAAVAKADGPAAPTGLAEVAKTDTTITVTANSAWEYSKDNGINWQDSNVFTGLTPNTTYDQIVARVKATATQEASANSAAISVTTDKGTADSDLQATLKNALTPYNAVYDKAAHNAFIVGTLPSGWSATYSTTESGTYGAMPQVTNVADSKTIWVKFSNANYSDYVTSYEVAVTAKPLTDAMVALGTAPTYNGSEQSISITVTDGAALTRDTDYTVSGTAALTDVAAAPVTVTITGTGNYSGTINKAWNLQKATPVITVVESKSIVKGVTTDLGATIAPDTLTLTYVSADTSKVTVFADGKVTGLELTETPVTVTVSFAGNGNYNPVSETVAVTVTDKTPVTVTFKDATSKTYTGSPFQLGAQFDAATVDGGKTPTGYKYNGTTYETLEALKAVEVTNVGTYTVTAYYETATEYGEDSASFTINKADQDALSITSSNTMKYGEELTLTVSGGSGDGAVTYEVTNGTGSATLSDGKLTATGVGTVTVKATKDGSTNYNPATATLTVTIDKADQTITAGNVSAAYGDTNAKVTATTSGDGAISYAVKSGSGDYIDVAADGTLTIKKVGTAYVTVTAGATDNYNSATKEVTVTIAPKAITAPAADTKTYTYNGKDQTYGVTGTADYTVSNGVQKNADSHTVTVALKDKENTVWADTKDAVDKTFSFVIKQATITITAKSKTAYVGDAVPELGESDYTVTGLAEGESLKTAPTITYISTPDMTKSGSVVIKVSDAEAPVGGNYEEIAYVNGTLTIITKSSGGSSGGGVSTYAITVETAKNGSVTSSHKTAAKGTTVTLTVAPDTGYELDTLTVTDGSGNKVSVTEKSGKYTFTMPASKVTVKAAFAAVVVEPENPFTDVPASAYYYDAVLWAADKGITGGTSATTFSPNATCTRAQAVTFLWRAAGSPAPKSGTMPFTDVPAGSYYEQAVLWAVEQGITKGTSDTTFSPNAECTRAQIVTFLWRSQGSPAAGSVNPFTDVAADAYYASAVLWAVENDGVIGGLLQLGFDLRRGIPSLRQHQRVHHGAALGHGDSVVIHHLYLPMIILRQHQRSLAGIAQSAGHGDVDEFIKAFIKNTVPQGDNIPRRGL